MDARKRVPPSRPPWRVELLLDVMFFDLSELPIELQELWTSMDARERVPPKTDLRKLQIVCSTISRDQLSPR